VRRPYSVGGDAPFNFRRVTRRRSQKFDGGGEA